MKFKYLLLIPFLMGVNPANAQYVRGATSYGFVPGNAYYYVPPAVVSPSNFWWPGYYDEDKAMSVYVNSNRFDPLDGGAWTSGRRAMDMNGSNGQFGWGYYGWGMDSWGVPYYSQTYIPSY